MPDFIGLGNAEWTLVELAGERIQNGGNAPRAFLVFDVEEAHVTGSGGCNRVMGTFALSESELRFGPLATTLMACPDPVMERERAFLEELARVTSFAFDGDVLMLLEHDDTIARLTR